MVRGARERVGALFSGEVGENGLLEQSMYCTSKLRYIETLRLDGYKSDEFPHLSVSNSWKLDTCRQEPLGSVRVKPSNLIP